MIHTIRACVAAASDDTAVRGNTGNLFLLLCQQAAQHLVGIAPAADKISDRGKRRHPDRLRGSQPPERIPAQIGAVFYGFHTGLQRGADRRVAVGVGHHRKAALVRKANHLPNVLRRGARLRQAAIDMEIDQSPDHQLDEIAPFRLNLVQKRAVLLPVAEAAADESAVMPLPVDREGRRAVVDAVLRRKRPRAQADAPCVAAVAQEGNAAGPVVRETAAEQRVVRRLYLRGNGGAPVYAVEDHMNVQVFHFSLSIKNGANKFAPFSSFTDAAPVP